jgi:hypothetical protein
MEKQIGIELIWNAECVFLRSEFDIRGKWGDSCSLNIEENGGQWD